MLQCLEPSSGRFFPRCAVSDVRLQSRSGPFTAKDGGDDGTWSVPSPRIRLRLHVRQRYAIQRHQGRTKLMLVRLRSHIAHPDLRHGRTLKARLLHAYANAPPRSKVIFSGIQPTGVPHLGNYLGALRQWVKLQDEASDDTTLLYSIVDLHAITVHQDPNDLRRCKQETLATLLSVGLDPMRSTIFFQSSVRIPAQFNYDDY